MEYGYDAVGNRKSMLDPSSRQTRWATTATASSASSVSESDGRLTTFGYDGNGNQITKAERTGWVTQQMTYGYDQDNRLRTVTVPAVRRPAVEDYYSPPHRMQVMDWSRLGEHGDAENHLTPESGPAREAYGVAREYALLFDWLRRASVSWDQSTIEGIAWGYFGQMLFIDATTAP